MGKQIGRCEWCGDITQGECGCPAEAEIVRLRAAGRPRAWWHPAGEVAAAGIDKFGVGALAAHGWEPLFSSADIDAAVAAERDRWVSKVKAKAAEADQKFPVDGTVAHWLMALVKVI